MKLGTVAAMAGALLTPIANSTMADTTGIPRHAETTMIDIAGHPVPVVKGGLYDRYRSNPPLSVIQAEAPGIQAWTSVGSKA